MFYNILLYFSNIFKHFLWGFWTKKYIKIYGLVFDKYGFIWYGVWELGWFELPALRRIL
jgi:hypothetical protein